MPVICVKIVNTVMGLAGFLLTRHCSQYSVRSPISSVTVTPHLYRADHNLHTKYFL